MYGQADQVVTGCALALGDHALEVIPQLTQSRQALLNIGCAGEPVHLGDQHLAVFHGGVGHAHEQLHRKLLGQFAQKLAMPALQNLVNELAGQLANPVLQLLHTRRGEKGVDDAAQLGVQGRIGLVRQGGRLARVGRVVHRVAGKLVRLAQHVARQSGAGHHPVPTVTGGVEDVGAALEKLCHATVRAALQHR